MFYRVRPVPHRSPPWEDGSVCQAAHSSQPFQKICTILEKFERNPAKLIPILQAIQEEYRYLPEEVMTFVATSLGLSPAKVYGVATFYSHFALQPKGKHIIRICDGTACHVKRSSDILRYLNERLGLGEGKQTSGDMLFTVETVSCLGACGIAPVVIIDEEVHGQMTPDKVGVVLDAILAKESAENAIH